MWKDIPNLQSYQVNELGEVRTLDYEQANLVGAICNIGE